MFIADFKPILLKNKLILPDQPYHDDFLQAMENIFKCSCIIGVLGTKKCISYVWSCIILFALLCIEVMAIWKVIKALAGWAIDTVGHRSVAARFAGTLFYSISMASMLLASRLSMSWHNIAAAWAKTESSLSLNIPVDRTVKTRMYIIAGLMLACSLTEHFMSVASTIGFDCPRELILKRYVLLSHGFMILRPENAHHVAQFLCTIFVPLMACLICCSSASDEYSEWFALPLAFISSIATLLWNFQDLIIILISVGLTSRYHRLNKYLARICAQEKNVREYNKTTAFIRTYIWRKLREAYVKQALLVRRIDKSLGGIIILSCICNFYFICLQLFLGITQGPTSPPIKQMYYIVSLSWLCIRVTSVILAASAINVNSQLALKHIYTYETRGYNIEVSYGRVFLDMFEENQLNRLEVTEVLRFKVERLQNQLTKDYVALSGMGFFYLNKTILLQMVGAIITYELMLIQFDNRGTENTDNIHLNITRF